MTDCVLLKSNTKRNWKSATTSQSIHTRTGTGTDTRFDWNVPGMQCCCDVPVVGGLYITAYIRENCILMGSVHNTVRKENFEGTLNKMLIVS